jgi:hypothetical protein
MLDKRARILSREMQIKTLFLAKQRQGSNIKAQETEKRNPTIPIGNTRI